MRTLVIDTATAACSVALIEHGGVIARAHEVVGRGHAERLIPMIAELPDGGRAARILVDVGPGSFTGVRVGIAAARGLAFGWGVTAIGYSSMTLIAAAAFARRRLPELAVILEGGHGEVFMQMFAPDAGPIGPLASHQPAAALALLGGRPAFGNGIHRLLALDPDIDTEDVLPDAADAILLADDPLPPSPIYGRAPDAKPLSAAASGIEGLPGGVVP